MTCQANSLIKHKHHIMPRYRGGSDDPSNLVEVSVVQHAMWHFCNYQLWRDDRDKLAFLALSGKVGKEDIELEKSRIGAKLGNKRFLEKMKDPYFREMLLQKQRERFNDPEFKKKNAEHLRSIQHIAAEAAKNLDAILKKKKTLKRINHQKGEKNSQYGTRWIHNLELKINSKVEKDCPLPGGWNEGRVMDFDKKLEKIKEKEEKKKILEEKRLIKEKEKGQKSSKRQLRKENSPVIGKKRDWCHQIYGTVLNVTATELAKKFENQKLNLSSLTQVALGRMNQHKGWKVLKIYNSTGGKNIPRNWVHEKYGEVKNVTVSELVDLYKDQKLYLTGLYKVCSGTRLQYRGWRLMEK